MAVVAVGVTSTSRSWPSMVAGAMAAISSTLMAKEATTEASHQAARSRQMTHAWRS